MKCPPGQPEQAQNIKAVQQMVPFFLQSTWCGSSLLEGSWQAQLNLALNEISAVATQAALRPHVLIIPLPRLFSGPVTRREKKEQIKSTLP